MPILRLLLVEPDVATAAAWSEALRPEGFDVAWCASGEDAMMRLWSTQFDGLVLSLDALDCDPFDLMAAARREERGTAIIAVGRADFDPARIVLFMRRGAADFLARPVIARDLATAFRRIDDERRADRERERVHSERRLVGDSAPMTLLREVMNQVADSNATVLILGESGTGKELVARALHTASPRKDGPFVAINCAAIPESLLESELFGHVKGAFTGAVQARLGRFELAHQGTLFLDEIGDMPMALQVKLLRVLQERLVEPVGGSRATRVDVRVVAATHCDLEQLVAAGRFRADLYYRLNVIPLIVPSLRERPEDIPELCTHLVERANRERGGAITGFSPEAIEAIRGYRWPGNVRELENLIERLVAVKRRGTVTLADIPSRYLGVPARARSEKESLLAELPDRGVDLRRALMTLETRLIHQALQRSGGNKNRAAVLLGLNRTTLVEKLKRMREEVAA